MGVPLIKTGKFSAGADLFCGEGVVIDVDEEVVVGDRCVLPDGAYLGGRRVEIGNDFYGYSWLHGESRVYEPFTAHTPLNQPLGYTTVRFGRWLDIGRGRKGEEQAVLTVGHRCTFHDNRIDLARRVTVGDDVGLSPEVVIYTHHYWLSPLDGYPCRYAPVNLGAGTIVGFRSVLLAGSSTDRGVVVGAQSVVTNQLEGPGVYAGNPARKIGVLTKPTPGERARILDQLLLQYRGEYEYRTGVVMETMAVDYPKVKIMRVEVDVEALTLVGTECEVTDDFRWFLFRHGIRVYTKRPFGKLPRGG